MNQKANAIIKTIPITQANPYLDDLSKTTKNMNQPMSQQVSRQNSRNRFDQEGDSDLEEIA
jgi:hypothetical protein